MSGYAVEPAATVEVVAAWAVPLSTVPAVSSGTGWVSLGEYFLPKSCTAQLEVLGLVSFEGLELTVRLWDTQAAAPVNGAVVTRSASPVRLLGSKVELPGNRTYQVQAQCVDTGEYEIGIGDSTFGIVQSATITD